MQQTERELKPKDRVLALWKPEDDDWRECEIISKNVTENGLMYYVHWSDFNRRNDNWISAALVNHATTKVSHSAHTYHALHTYKVLAVMLPLHSNRMHERGKAERMVRVHAWFASTHSIHTHMHTCTHRSS